MRWRISLVVALVTFVAVSCDQQPVEPAAEQVAEAPAFNFMNGPLNPGNSGIDRWNGWSWGALVDFDEGLILRLYDALDQVRCGGDTPRQEMWDIQDIWGDSFDPLSPPWEEPFPWDLISVSKIVDVPLTVHPLGHPNPGVDLDGYCEFMQDEVLAVGTGKARVNDNNVFWWTGTGGNNSYGVRVQGTVQDGDGNWYNVHGNNHYTVKGLCCVPQVDPADEWIKEMSTIEWIKYTMIRSGQN